MVESGMDALSKMSGIDKSDIKKIAEGVMENNKKLNHCSSHDFSIQIGDGLRAKYKCKHCGGVVDGIKKNTINSV